MCGAPNAIPNPEQLPDRAGNRWGANLGVSVHGPALWKAAGGPGAMTTVLRLCIKCSCVVLDMLASLGLLSQLSDKERKAFGLMRVPPKP